MMASKNLLRNGLVTAAGAALAFLVGAHAPLGQLIWPPAPMPEPTPGQQAAFMAYGVYQSVAFGLGIVFVILLVNGVRKNARAPAGSIAAVVSLAWLLLSWVPHDNLHQTVGMDPAGLVALEWTFHATLILATFVVARFVLRRLTETVAPSRAATASPDRVPVKG